VSLKHTVFNMVTSPLIALLCKPYSPCVSIVEAARPIYRQRVEGTDSVVAYECPSQTALWRARTLYSKEPDTIQWLNSLPAGDVVYDVGANVGLYSIYAGVRGLSVFAFEPEAKNFSLLNRNIQLNGLQDRVSGFCLALGRRTEINYIHLSSDVVGGAINNFGAAVDYDGKPFSATHKQGAMSIRLDDLWETFGMPHPHHIKIDVDGLEAQIVEGAERTLRSAGLKSVLVELNDVLPSDMEIVQKMKSFGLCCRSKFHAPMFDNTKFSNIYNYIFVRQ
jgi:FkbM family methyltransferase